MKRNVILGLQRVTWDEFISSTLSLLSYLGEEIDPSYLTAMSGNAFRMSFDTNQLNPGQFHVEYNSAIIYHTFDVLGIDADFNHFTDYDASKQHIIASIDRGMPVMVIEGPVSCSGTNLITGYDEDGDILMGWSAHMDIPDDHNEPHDTTGYYHKSNWFAQYRSEGTVSPYPPERRMYVTVKGRKAKPSDKAIALRLLNLAVRLIEGGEKDGYYRGYPAYGVYADYLVKCSSRFPANYLLLLCNDMMLKDKLCVPEYLSGLVAVLPEYKKELEAGAETYRRIAAIVKEMEQAIPEDFSQPAIDAFTNLQVRETYAGNLLRIRDLESEFASGIKLCLAK